MVRYLSYDCAHKSLAIAQVNFGDIDVCIKAIRSQLARFINNYCGGAAWEYLKLLVDGDRKAYRKIAELSVEHPESAVVLFRDINCEISKLIIPERCAVLDILPGRKVKEVNPVERLKLLKKALDDFDVDESIIDKTLIEDQPGAFNFKSATIRDHLMMYHGDADLYLVNPHHKNKVWFRDDLVHDHFVATCRDKYTANKAHTRANFVYFLEAFGHTSLLVGIKKENYDDIADAFMQAVAFHFGKTVRGKAK